MPPQTLTERQAALWRVGVPAWLFIVGPVATVIWFVATLPSEAEGQGTSIDALVSGSYTVLAMLMGALVLGCCVGGVAPRTAAVSAGLSPLMVSGPDSGLQEAAALVLWSAVLIWDASMRRHQVAVAEEWSTKSAARPRGGGIALWEPISAGLAVVLVGAVVATSWIWSERQREFRAVADRSTTAVGTFQSMDFGFAVIEVLGQTYEFGDEAFMHLSPGQQVTVNIDPQGEKRPWGPDDADPDFSSGFAMAAGAGLLGLVLVVGGSWWRRESARQLLAGESAGVHMRWAHGLFGRQQVLLPIDGDRPIGVLLNVRRVVEHPTSFNLHGAVPTKHLPGADDARSMDGLEAIALGLSSYGNQALFELCYAEKRLVVTATVMHPGTLRSGVQAVRDRLQRRGPRHSKRSEPGHEREPRPGTVELFFYEHAQEVRRFLPLLSLLAAVIGWWLWTPSAEEHPGAWWSFGLAVLSLILAGRAMWDWSRQMPFLRGQELVFADRWYEKSIDIRAVTYVREYPNFLELSVADGEPVLLTPIFPGTGHGRLQVEQWCSDIENAVAAASDGDTPARGIQRRFSSGVWVGMLFAVPFMVAAIIACRGQMPLM